MLYYRIISIVSVRDLRIYSLANELLPQIYEIQTPEIDLNRQLKRAARSIAANISEGYARKDSSKEFKRFLRIALGSSDEVQTHLEQIQLIYKIDTHEAIESFRDLSRQINKTIQVWN